VTEEKPGARSIDAERVRAVARLASLSLEPSEVTALERDLGRILDYVDELNTLDTDHVEPMTHATALATPQRDDVSEPGLSIEDIEGNAPAIGDRAFLVPKVIGG